MTATKLGKYSVIGAFALAVLLFQGCKPEGELLIRKPLNIVLILSEGHSPSAIGAYNPNSPVVRTPGIDSLAKGGSIFTDCITADWETWRQIEDSLPQRLSAKGYSTAFFGLWDYGNRPESYSSYTSLEGEGNYYNPMLRKDGVLLFKEGHVSSILADEAVEWLQGKSSSHSPFLMVVHNYAMNGTWMPDIEDLGKFSSAEGATLAEDDTLTEDFVKKLNVVYHLKMADPSGKIHTPGEQKLEMMGRDLYRRDLRPYDPLVPGRMTSAQQKEWDAHYNPIMASFRKDSPKGNNLLRWKYGRFLEDYLETANSVDRGITKIMESLKEGGQLDNTVVIYTSAGSLIGGETPEVPLIIRHPANGYLTEGYLFRKGEVDGEVSAQDIYPTLIEFSGETAPEWISGESIISRMTRKDPSKKSSWKDIFKKIRFRK